MSLNDSVTFHESLAAPKKHHGGHHGRGHRIRFRRLIDPAYYEQGYPYWYGPEYGVTRSVDDEVAFHEGKHDVIVVESPGHKQQIRQAVVNALKSRGWVESTKEGAKLLSPPGFVAVMKGLGMIHGLGDILPPNPIQPAEIMGLGVGTAMVIGGIVVEGKLGLVLGLVGGAIGLFAGGSAVLRALSTSSQAQGAAAAAQQQQVVAAQQAAAAPPPPPPPPPKPTSSQRLQQSIQAYGPIAAEIIKGVITLF